MSETGTTLRTPDFGDISFSGNHIFTFPEGLHGFEQLTSFILIAEEATEPFKWLISTENPAIGFPLVSPWHIDHEFTLGSGLPPQTVPMVVVALTNEYLEATANMKAPILFDCAAMTGRQVILSGSGYSTAFRLLRKAVSADNAQSGARRLFTSQFGVVDVAADNILTFPEGLLGFDNLREFVLISVEETEPMKWLISLDEPSIGFPLLSPWIIDVEYDLREQFDASKQAAFAVVTLVNPQGKMSANMKAPVIIGDDRTGKQIILSSDKYSPTQEFGGAQKQ
jgi:flagellar assembly factor FliW